MLQLFWFYNVILKLSINQVWSRNMIPITEANMYAHLSNYMESIFTFLVVLRPWKIGIIRMLILQDYVLKSPIYDYFKYGESCLNIRKYIK